MSRIDVNFQSLFAQHTSRTALPSSLHRLGAGLRVSRAADELALSSAAPSADYAPNGLQEISSLLAELETIVASSTSATAPTAERQQRVDAILGSIDKVANARGFAGLSALRAGPVYQISNTDSQVVQAAVSNATVPAGGALDVDIVHRLDGGPAGFTHWPLHSRPHASSTP